MFDKQIIHHLFLFLFSTLFSERHWRTVKCLLETATATATATGFLRPHSGGQQRCGNLLFKIFTSPEKIKNMFFTWISLAIKKIFFRKSGIFLKKSGSTEKCVHVSGGHRFFLVFSTTEIKTPSLTGLTAEVGAMKAWELPMLNSWRFEREESSFERVKKGVIRTNHSKALTKDFTGSKDIVSHRRVL